MAPVDHLVYAVRDLDAGIRHLEERLGVRAGRGGQHPAFGTCNALMSMGNDRYLEIIAPDPTLPPPDRPRLFGLDDIVEPRLVTWVAKGAELEKRMAGATARGAALGDVTSGSRRTPDGGLVSFKVTDPYAWLGDGVVPFFVDWGSTPHPSRTAPAGCTLLDLRAEHPDADGVRGLLDAVGVELEVAAGPAPALIARIRSPKGEVELR